ncbi:PKD1L3 [Branchiostoma lanceolatum]|uniref:PKD1L3 protein n=1 Tax=Branchiostoma lanceolatum TaxID=7740 RepID=A0A8K0EXR2_BRALA|nr:PKD1L3 [Branchiostoma lanceolatum]
MSLEEESRSIKVTIDGLKSGSKYNVKVRNVVSTSEKTDSPQFLTCSTATYTSLAISWIKPRAPLTGYRVSHTLVSNSPSDVITRDLRPENEKHVLQDVLTDREYSLTLVAVGMYKDSSPVEVTCATLTPPPEDFQVTDITETSVTVSWKQRTNSLAINHRMWIRRSDTAESLFTQFLSTVQTEVTFTDLIPATEYVISATSINKHNEGPAVNLTVGTKTDSPMALGVELKTTNTITISWLKPKAVLIAYNITYTEDGRSTSLIKSAGIDSCELTGLVPGTQYDIELVAASRLGKSIAIGKSVVTDTDPPSSLRVTKSSATWLFLEWTPPVANILSYNLDISDEYGDTRTLRVDGHRTVHNVTGLLPETTYVIKMAADSEHGSLSFNGVSTTASPYTTKGTSTTDERSTTVSPTPFWTKFTAVQDMKDMTLYAASAKPTTEDPGEKSTMTGDITLGTVCPTVAKQPNAGSEGSATGRAQLQELLQDLDQSLTDAVVPGDILAVTSNIKQIIKPNDDSAMPLAISVALVQTASIVIDMLPEQETQTAGYSDNLFESDLIDTSSTDLSPKQQLKMFREKQNEREDMVAETLLTLQPEDVEYHSSFKTESVAVNMARSPSDKDLLLDSGDIVANIPPTPGPKTRNMVDVRMSVFKKNPYSWSKATGGQNITSSVALLTINPKTSGDLSKELKVKLDMAFVPSKESRHSAGRPSHVTTERPSRAEENTNGTTMAYHAFNVQYDNVIPVIRMNWWDVEATFHVYISYGSPPTEEKYDEKRVIKRDGYEDWLRGTNFSASLIPHTTKHGGRMLYVGVQKLGSVSSVHSHQQQPTVQVLDKDDYTLSMSAVGCSSWKDSKKQWKLEGCDTDIDLDHGTISCQCHVTEGKVSVGTMTLPLPNSINFINAFKNFRNLSENSVVFSIVVSDSILYILLMVFLCADFHRIWMLLRRRVSPRISPISGESGGENNQRKTLDKVSLIPPDRMPARHVYQITVTTGSMFGAGTTSRIGFQLFGSEGTTPVKMLNPKGEALVRGSTLHFVMPVRESLGEVMTLHIWHDNSGEGDTSSWFLGSFLVRDIEKDVVSYFTCNDWLSSEKGDGKVQKVVHASTKEELTSFTNVFNEATRDVVYDKQLWASALVAAPGSSFTKAQRLSCCFTILKTMMLASAMWYNAENTATDPRVLNLGFVRFTIEELYISVMTVLTVLPVNLMLLQLFRMEAPLSVNTPEMSIRPSKQDNFRKAFFRLAKCVAWVTVFLVSTISAFFVILYSMDWGKERSDSWIKAFILSFMGSSCVVDTLQIFVLAVVLAAMFALQSLAKPPTIQKEDLQLNLWNSTAPKKVYPPAKPNGHSARNKKELSKKSASVLKEFLLLFIFVVLLFYIAQADKDKLAFYETQSLSNNILQEYDAITTPDQFYEWTVDILLPTLYPATWYNGRDMKYIDRQFAHNTGSFRLGPARLTQVRQHPGELGFERFVDLQTAAYRDACFKHILGLVVFINTISLLRVVRFSQSIGKLLALPGIMKGELISFLVVAAVAFMAFISSGFIIFGSEMESYTDLYHISFALFEMMLGRFFAQDMLDSNPLTGPIFFTTFMICIFILLMNFLMTIICDAISADIDVNHDRELADHMWENFRAMLGFHSTPNEGDKLAGVLKIEELKDRLCILGEKLDEGLDICNSILPSHLLEKLQKNLKEPCNTSCQIISEEPAPRQKQNVTIATRGGELQPSQNMWISDLKLTTEDKAVLLSDDMLTDKHIHAAQMLLRRQYPGLGGLQDTVVGASVYGYIRVSGEGLQIHHAGILHWVVSSSIGGHVSVYNSLPSKINASLEHQLCQCYAPPSNIDTDVLTVKVPCVQVQGSRFTCGLFAIAWAVDIAMGTDVTQVRYEESRMRAHLLDCFERGHLSPFPQTLIELEEEAVPTSISGVIRDIRWHQSDHRRNCRSKRRSSSARVTQPTKNFFPKTTPYTEKTEVSSCLEGQVVVYS